MAGENDWTPREHDAAMAIVERYFDVDIVTPDDAYSILVDNGVRADLASAISMDMYLVERLEDDE